MKHQGLSKLDTWLYSNFKLTQGA